MKITNTNIEKLEDGFFLITTPNCPTCEKLKNSLKQIETDTKLTEINAYDHAEIAQQLGIIGTPCLIDYRDNREYDRLYGAKSIEKLEAFFKGE